MADLESGSFVEGSTRHGGIQPDYILDTWSPEMKPLMDFAYGVKLSTDPYWTKVDRIVEFVSNRVLPGTDYDIEAYQ